MMRIRTLVSGMLALPLAFSTAIPLAAEDGKAAEILAAARKAIGGKKLDALKTLSVEAALQRNVNEVQMNTDVEILLELPDKYVRSDSSNGMMGRSMRSGFSGDRAIRPANVMMAGGGMIVRFGGPGGPMTPSAEKPTAEEQQRIDEQMLRSARTDISRLMLGWFASAHPSLQAEYTYAGEAESPDGNAHVIDVKSADGFTARLFTDPESSLPLMVTYQAPQPRVVMQGGPRRGGESARGGGQVVRRELSEEDRKKLREEADAHLKELQTQPVQMADYALYFDDWREVDGIFFPHRIRRATNGATHEEWTIEKVRINPRLDAKKFEN